MSALLCFRPQPRALLRVVAFPWAGASAAALRPLSDALANPTAQAGPVLELHSVAYAGRGHRKSVALPASLDDVVADVVAAIAALPAPIALYGHSFGAIAAFFAAVRLREHGVAVAHVVAAARAAPSVDLRPARPGVDSAAAVRDLDDDALLALLAGHGAVDAPLFADPEARAFFLPPLRRDLELSEGARCDDVIDVPLTAIRGRDDASVSADDLVLWQRHTRSSFAAHTVDGGHLFVRDHAAAFASLLKRVLCP